MRLQRRKYPHLCPRHRHPYPRPRNNNNKRRQHKEQLCQLIFITTTTKQNSHHQATGTFPRTPSQMSSFFRPLLHCRHTTPQHRQRLPRLKASKTTKSQFSPTVGTGLRHVLCFLVFVYCVMWGVHSFATRGRRPVPFRFTFLS